MFQKLYHLALYATVSPKIIPQHIQQNYLGKSNHFWHSFHNIKIAATALLKL